MKKLLALALVLMLALTAVPAVLAEGNVLRYGMETEPAGFDPHTCSSHASIRVMSQVYNQLVDLDENLVVIPEIAKTWEVSEDLKTYTFHLADNVTFHSGRKMTAADVKYSFERILDPALGALGKGSPPGLDVLEGLLQDQGQYHLPVRES